MTDPILVPLDAENAARFPTSATKQLKVVDFAIEETRNTPTITKDVAVSCSIIRETIRKRKVLDDIAKISRSRGDLPHSQNMKQSLKNGNNVHYQGMKIPLIHL